jgi:hypothetical protein
MAPRRRYRAQIEDPSLPSDWLNVGSKLISLYCAKGPDEVPWRRSQPEFSTCHRFQINLFVSLCWYSDSDSPEPSLSSSSLARSVAIEAQDSWRGSDREFVAAGFSTTPWYQSFDETHLRAAVEEYSRVPCPVCGGTR